MAGLAKSVWNPPVVSLLDIPASCGLAVTRQEIEALIGPLAEAEEDAKRSPGRMARHYAPNSPVRLEADAAGRGRPIWPLVPIGQALGCGISAPLAISPRPPLTSLAIFAPPI